MNSPQRRSGNRPSRRQREAKAYRLTLATGGFGTLAVVTLVLAFVTGLSAIVPILLFALAGGSYYMLKNTLGKR